MSASAVLAPLPVLIPLLAAAATLLAGRRPRVQRIVAVLALLAVVAVCAVLVHLADRDGTIAVQVGGRGQSIPGASGATGEGPGGERSDGGRSGGERSDGGRSGGERSDGERSGDGAAGHHPGGRPTRRR